MKNTTKKIGGGGRAPSSSISSHTLPGGLRVVIDTIPFVRSVSFGIWVRTGSRNETTRQHGMAHFTEHMLFKGTEKRTATEIAETMDAVGGQLNAFTSKEYTCYLTRTLDTHFDTALDVLTDMFFNSKFDVTELEKERNVILEEIFMAEDSPGDLVVELMQQRILEKSLGHPILGVADTINKFKRDDFLAFVEKNYRPNNTVIAVAGNVCEQTVLEKISAAFDHFQSGLKPRKPARTLYTPGFIARDKDNEQVHLCLGFPGIGWSANKENFALAAVSTILGGGMSSRLFQKLREEHGLVYTVYSQNISFFDTGFFMIYAALNPSQLNDALRLIIDEVRGLFTQRITEEQLAKTKEQFKSNTLMGLESTNNRMNTLALSELLLDKIVTPDETVAKIDAITLDDFYAVSERVFNLEKASLSLVGRGVEELELSGMLCE